MFIYRKSFRPLMLGLVIIAITAVIPFFAGAADKPVPEIFVQLGHTSSVAAVEFSPDGRFILSGSGDHSSKLWDAQSGRLIRTFKDTDGVKFIAFLPDGQSFFSVNDKGNICTWDLRTGNKIKEFALGEMSYSSLRSNVVYDRGKLRVIAGLKFYQADPIGGVASQLSEAPPASPIRSYLGFSFGFRNVIGTDGKRMLSSVKETPEEATMASKNKTMMWWDLATGRILSTLSGHTDLIDVMALSPDERLALSGSRDKTVRLWDVKRGKALAVFSGHQNAVEALAFSPDMKYVLSGSSDRTMKLWSIDGEKEVLSFPHDCTVTYVRFSPDGRKVISGDYNGAIRIWDIQSGREILALKSFADGIYAFALSPDGRQVLTGSKSGQIKLWDAASGRLIKMLAGHRDAISAMAFTPDGRSALSASWDRDVKLWDLREGQLVTTFSGHRGQVYRVAVSSDGKRVLSSGQGGDMGLWDIASGRLLQAFRADGSIESIGFTADGRHLIVAYDQKQSGRTVKILTSEGREVKHYKDVEFDRYSNDGRYFLARSYKDASQPEQKLFQPGAKAPETNIHSDRFRKRILVDIENGRVLGHFGQSGAFLSLATTSADPNLVLTKNRYEQDICLWDTLSGKAVRRFPAKFGILSRDGSKVIVPVGKSLQTIDTMTGRPGRIFTGSAAGEIISLTLSAQGGYAATGDNAGEVQFWDIATGALLKSIKAEANNLIGAVAFSPDNRYAASVTRFGSGKVWGLEDGRKISEFQADSVMVLGAEDYADFGMGILAFSPDGRYLASGVKLWEAATGRQVLEFQTPFGPGAWVTFSPDGDYLLSRNMIWETRTGRRVKRMESIASVTKSFYSADGKWIYAADGEGAFHVVDPETGKLVRSFFNYLYPYSFEVSRDKKKLLAAEIDATGVTMWDLPSGRKSAVLELHQSPGTIRADAGMLSAVTNQSTSLKHLDLVSGREVAQYISFVDGEWIVITPEGYYNASPGGERYLNVRSGNQVYGIENYREAFFRPDLVKTALSGGSLKDFRKLADVGVPPAVKIVDAPSSVTTDEVTVKLHLADQGGGIGDIRLYLNGTAVVMDSRAVTVREKTGKSMVKTYMLKLVNGKNTIRAIAFNADNSMQSNDAVHEVAASFASSAKPSLSALVIGINHFKNPKLRLQYSAADADLFADTLKAAAEGLFDKVTIKKLTRPEETTQEAILREIQSFQKLRPDDLFVFYLASHGTVDEGEYFLITSNVGSLRTEKLKTDAVSQHMLKDAVANIPATKKLIIIDTCNAGALGEAIQVAMLTRGMSEDTALKILSRAVGSTILSASTSLQEALEGYQGHGLFTYVLAEGLKGKADKGKTGYVKTTDLADYVDNEVPQLAEKIFKRAQYPTISVSGQAFPVGKAK